jgi:hypothetical protein
VGILVIMVHADALVGTVPSRSPHVYSYSICILLPPLPVPKTGPKMDLFVVGSSLQVRATRGLLFGLIDTMSAVDSGAITPLLRTSGSACCPWGLGSGESLC